MAKEKIIARKGKYLTLDKPYTGRFPDMYGYAALGINIDKINKALGKADDWITKAGSKALGIMNTASGALDAYRYNTQGADLTEQNNQISTLNNFNTNSGTLSGIAADVNNLSGWDNMDAQTARGTTFGQRAGNTLKNVVQAKGLWGKLGALGAGVAGELVGGWKARNTAARMNAAGNIAEERALNNAGNQIDNVEGNAYDQQMLQFAALGGNLLDRGGYMDTEFTNGVKEINAGGSHEESPYEGVPMGEGNLVEEGEVIKDNYVYSNRLHPTAEQLKSVGLPTKYKKYTYAKIAEELNKESKETPNDPISKRTLDSNFEKLKTIAEQSRKSFESETQMAQQNGPNVFANSGELDENPKSLKQHALTDGISVVGDDANDLMSWADEAEKAGLLTWNRWRTDYPEKWVPGSGTITKLSLWPEKKPSTVKPPSPKTTADSTVKTPVTATTTAVNTGSSTETTTTEAPVTESGSTGSSKSRADIIAKVLEENGIKIEIPTSDATGTLEVQNTESTDKDTTTNKDTTTEETVPTDIPKYQTWMRYAPIFGAGSAVFSDALGLTNRPDYSAADVAERAAYSQRGVRFDPIGDYVQRKPLDRNYYLTQLANQNLAAQRAASNAANRYQANAMNLAGQYNAGEGIGKTLMQMDQYNAQDALKAAEFNRGTNQYNSEGALKEQIANAEANTKMMTGLLQAAQLRAAEKQRTDQARSINLTNFFDNIGELGRENMAFNMVNSNKSQYYGIDRSGNLFYKQAFFDADPETQKQIVAITGVEPDRTTTSDKKTKTKGSKKDAFGGYLTVKSKK